MDDVKEMSGYRKLKERALVSLSTVLALGEGMDLSSERLYDDDNDDDEEEEVNFYICAVYLRNVLLL